MKIVERVLYGVLVGSLFALIAYCAVFSAYCVSNKANEVAVDTTDQGEEVCSGGGCCCQSKQ